MRRGRAALLVLCTLLAATCAALIAGCAAVAADSPRASQDVEGELVVRFIDVGQGDCALLTCNGHHLLIDGGPRDASRKVYSIVRDVCPGGLDAMIASHPDADHIGGLAAALNAVPCAVCYCSEDEADGDLYTFAKLLSTLDAKTCPLVVPQAGDAFALGDATVTFVGPVRRFEDDNNNSLVCRVDFGTTSFLFTGDAESEAEDALVESRADLAADVLKVAHHGSSSSSTPAFLHKVHPRYAVISVGVDNTYGHPTARTLDRLGEAGATIYRTDADGSVIMRSDGKRIEVTTTDYVSE